MQIVGIPSFLLQQMFNIIRTPSKFDFAEIEQVLIAVQNNQQLFPLAPQEQVTSESTRVSESGSTPSETVEGPHCEENKPEDQ
jgi:hypothetical protein